MIWTSSSAFKAVIEGVNKAYNLRKIGHLLNLPIISMLGILSLAIIVMLALSILVFGNVIGYYINGARSLYINSNYSLEYI